MNWRLLSQSAIAIVTREQAKKQTNTEDFPDDDDLISALCDVVTRHLDGAGGIGGRALLTQTWEITAAAPECYRGASLTPQGSGFLIDRTPLQAIEKVEVMQAGVYVEIPSANYVTRYHGETCVWLRMVQGLAWPSADCDEAAFKITARLGYGDAPADVPGPLRHAALLHLAHLYQNREAVSGFGANLQETPMGYEALIAPYRIYRA
jgi:uncharacterized phiE125 gp8 family phage protein